MFKDLQRPSSRLIMFEKKKLFIFFGLYEHVVVKALLCQRPCLVCNVVRTDVGFIRLSKDVKKKKIDVIAGGFNLSRCTIDKRLMFSFSFLKRC